MKYAIGEIILVVIGILIALSINNWNSDRLQAKRNKQLLFKMSKELEQHKQRIESLLDNTNPAFGSRLVKIDSINYLLEEGIQSTDLDYIIKAPSYYTIILNLNTFVFNELINTGSLYSLGSDSLVKNIQTYYKQCEKEEFYNQDIGRLVSDLRNECYEGFIDLQYWYNRNPEKAITIHSWIFDPESEKYRMFRQYMTTFETHNNMMVDQLTYLNEQCSELKMAIDYEIEML